MTLKVAVIGAGSLTFTRRLVHDILAVPELADTAFAFTDISEQNLERVTQLCRGVQAAHGQIARVIERWARKAGPVAAAVSRRYPGSAGTFGDGYRQ